MINVVEIPVKIVLVSFFKASSQCHDAAPATPTKFTKLNGFKTKRNRRKCMKLENIFLVLLCITELMVLGLGAVVAKRDELEEQLLLHSREREQELQASNRRQLEQITFMKKLPIVSPSIGRKNITRVGKAGMRILREGGGDDEEEEEFEVDEVEQDKEEGEGRLSARRRKKKKKMKKKSSSSPGNEKGGDRGVVLRFGPNSIQQQKKTLAKQGSSTARRRATKAKKKKKKPVMARLSAEGGGPVTVVIDRSLFMTGGTKGGARRSPKRRSNRYFGSPLRGSVSSSSTPSPASGRLLWGFAPPPVDSYVPETGGMAFR